MDLNAFTAGVEPGGLTHGYEIKILVCYLLGEFPKGLSFAQINESLLSRGLVNYFELANAFSSLTESGHLVENELHDHREDSVYTLSPLGLQTSLTFAHSLPASVREKALKSAKELLARQRREAENLVSIRDTDDGCIVDMTVCDIGSDLLSLSLFMPSRHEAELVRTHFLNDPLLIYKGVLALLTGDLGTVGDIVATQNEVYEETV